MVRLRPARLTQVELVTGRWTRFIPYRAGRKPSFTRAGALARLFERFDTALRERGYLAMGGQTLGSGPRADATVIEARRPRLSKDEKQIVRGGEAAGEIAVPAYGYKYHIGIGRAHGFVRRFTVTHAARHDGSQLGAVLDTANTASGVWADTAYRSQANLDLLEGRGLVAQFQRGRPRGKTMPPHIARGNATRARVRSRVEDVFAATNVRMGLIVRIIGLARATAKITLANLADNLTRLVWIQGRTAPA